METLKELVAAAKSYEGTVIDAADRSAPYSYGEFATNSFKAANLFVGHYGVHPGSSVAVAVGPKERPEGDSGSALDAATGIPDAADPLLAILGGTAVGATVDLRPEEPVDARALVFPAWREFETTGRCSPIAYGGPPDDPTVAHFETELWSENPTEPPEPVAAADPALRANGEEFTHAALLDAAADVVENYGLEEASRVGLSAGLPEPGAFVAGVLAPLSVGATIILPSEPANRAQAWPADESDVDVLITAGKGERHQETAGRTVGAGEITASLRDTGRA